MSSNPDHARCIRYKIMWYSLSVTDRWIFPATPLSSTNKTDSHDKTEKLFQVVLNILNQPSHTRMMHNYIFNEEQRSEHLSIYWSHYVVGLLFSVWRHNGFRVVWPLYLFTEASNSFRKWSWNRLVLAFLWGIENLPASKQGVKGKKGRCVFGLMNMFYVCNLFFINTIWMKYCQRWRWITNNDKYKCPVMWLWSKHNMECIF